MRNRYPGTCYRCGEHVAVGDGHFERFRGGWRTQHATCAIEMRGTPDLAREADRQQRLERRARGTGKSAQRARAALRAQQVGDPA
jgi:hypothetical protein